MIIMHENVFLVCISLHPSSSQSVHNPPFILCVSVCAHTYGCMNVQVYIECTRMQVHMWKPEDNVRISFSLVSPTYVLR